YSWSIFRIAERGDHPDGLVENVIDLVLRLADGAPVDLDHVLVEIGLAPQLAHHLAVDGDVPGLDHRLGLAARRDAGVREYLLQSFEHQPCFSGACGGVSTAAAFFAVSSAWSIALSSCANALSLSTVACAIRSATAGSCASSVRPATGGADGVSSSTILRDSSDSSWNSRKVGSCVRSRRLNNSRNSFEVP